MVISYRRFGTTCRSHPQGSRGPMNPKDGTDSCSDTSARNYHYSLRNKPQERSSLLWTSCSLCGGNLSIKHIFRFILLFRGLHGTSLYILMVRDKTLEAELCFNMRHKKCPRNNVVQCQAGVAVNSFSGGMERTQAKQS